MLTGTLPDLTREQATERILARRRQGHRARCPRRRLRRRGRVAGLQAREGRAARRDRARRGRPARAARRLARSRSPAPRDSRSRRAARPRARRPRGSARPRGRRRPTREASTPRIDQSPEQRPALLLAVVVRAGGAGEKAEPVVQRRERRAERVRGRGLEPAVHPRGDAAQHRAGLARLAQELVEPVQPPDREQVRGRPAARPRTRPARRRTRSRSSITRSKNVSSVGRHSWALIAR